jgi:hypothetical protein
MALLKERYRYGFVWGCKAEIARELGVSRSTICKDIRLMFYSGWYCPTCGKLCDPNAFGYTPIRTRKRGPQATL